MTKITTATLGLLALVAGGCAQTSRYVTAEHWHDEGTFFVAYTAYEETNYIVTRSGASSAHVMMCRVSDDNSATCRPQVAIDRLLNPDEEIEAPPPLEAAPEPEPEAPAEEEGGEEPVS